MFYEGHSLVGIYIYKVGRTEVRWRIKRLWFVKDPKFIRLYKCCYYKFININTPTKHINYHKINIFRS